MQHRTRRGFLTLTLGGTWAAASVLERASLLAADARARARQAQPTLFDIQKITEGVYAARARGRALINSNSVIFENTDGLLIVDSQAAPSAVAALVAQIRREITPKPVRYVVVTHLHGDHTQGLPEHRRSSPDLRILSTEFTRAQLAANGAARLQSATENARRSLATFSDRAAATASAEERTYWQEMARETREFIAETEKLPVELPDITVDDHLVIHDRAHELRIFFQGRGHTAGDLFVYCPEKKVIATGDMFHSFFPSMADSYPGEWQTTLRKVAQLSFDAAIGGHGGPQQSPLRIADWCVYLDELGEIVARARQQGTPLDKLVESVTPASLTSLTANGYADFLLAQMKRDDLRIRMNTPAEVAARYVRDNLTAVFRNLGRS